MDDNKVYCEDCARWYHTTRADQCEVPASGFQLIYPKSSESQEDFNRFLNYMRAIRREDVAVDERAIEFIRNHLSFIHYRDAERTVLYAYPSELNLNNDCYFFKPHSCYYLFGSDSNGLESIPSESHETQTGSSLPVSPTLHNPNLLKRVWGFLRRVFG